MENGTQKAHNWPQEAQEMNPSCVFESVLCFLWFVPASVVQSHVTERPQNLFALQQVGPIDGVKMFFVLCDEFKIGVAMKKDGLMRNRYCRNKTVSGTW
jgi:hypothetical protein